MQIQHIEAQAFELLNHVSNGYVWGYQVSWTMSIYDTAWLSMIKKPGGDWLFPESFDYILRTQNMDSGWVSKVSNWDDMLNTLSASIALEKRIREDKHLTSETRENLRQRRSHALTYLQKLLDTWDVESCLHVGFEILVPALLRMLDEYGFQMQFAGRKSLHVLNEEKLKNFDAEAILYGPSQTTVLHSLEAFVGKIDFSRVSHHKVGGSILGSPSATAAYLMNAPTWDNEAERYLQRVIQLGGGSGLGGVPSAFPCEIFELTWVRSCHVLS